MIDKYDKTYNVKQLKVISSSKISQRAKAIIEHLNQNETTLPGLIVLTAQPKAASKLISIVEIVKRQIQFDKLFNVYQYTTIIPEKVVISSLQTNDEQQNKEDDQSEIKGPAFESRLGNPKFRIIPILTIYLTTRAIPELKAQYG